MKRYYMLETNDADKSAELYIFGDITSYPWYEDEVSAYGLVKQLQDMDVEHIKVHINSYGGEVKEGLAIYNALKDSKMKVTTICDGFACSAASVVFMAGDERIIKEASLLMIHNAWTFVRGDSNALRKQADDLEKITQASVNAYKSKATISEDEIKELMNNETWITAKEAVEYGFATKTEIEDERGVSQSVFGNIRETLLKPEIAPAQIAGAEKGRKIDTDEIAGKVVEKLMPLMQEKWQQKEKKSTSWGAFFD